MIKKLNFVRDVKSGDLIAPQFVPSHISTLRQYITVTDKERDSVLVKFPEDYELVTCDFEENGSGFRCTETDVTSFKDIVRSFDDGEKSS